MPLTVPDEIEQAAADLARRGVAIEEVVLGAYELRDLAEWAEPRYLGAVENALEASLPFHWHGLRITPARREHAFTIMLS